MFQRPKGLRFKEGSGKRAFNEYLNNEIKSAGARVGPESGLAVPHVLSINPIIGTAYQTFIHGQFDEAIRNSPENAFAMRNDPFLMRLLNERKLAVCSLNSSIEVDNERDPDQKAFKDSLTRMWKSIPYPSNLHDSLLEAIWYGRAASEFIWDWKNMKLPAFQIESKLNGSTMNRRTLGIKWHIPYNGDKIGYDYNGCPYVLVSTQAAVNLQKQGADIGYPNINAQSMEYGYTTAGGQAVFLRTPSWRQRFAIHQDMCLDGPFNDAQMADSIHGVGIRSVIYWYWWLRDEFLSNVADWCARTGLGVRIWYYDSGNPSSQAQISQVARDQSDKVNIMVPRTPGQDPAEGVEFVDTTGSGADLLLRIVEHIEQHIELYVVGQSMSRGSQEGGSGFGDRGRSDFARDTKFQITKRDAKKYGDTCTNDILRPMIRWSFPPEYHDINARVVFSTESPEPEAFMNGVSAFTGLGGIVDENQVRSVLGLSDVHDGSKTLGGVAPLPPGMSGTVEGGGPNGGGKVGSDHPDNGRPTKLEEAKNGPSESTYQNGRVIPENVS